ncbi:SDR family NAD(P)-dependent oxidoreductase [Sorangium sp. So ce1182]
MFDPSNRRAAARGTKAVDVRCVQPTSVRSETMQGKRVALVTGANQGIGLQIAKELAAKSFTVLVGSRNFARGERRRAPARRCALRCSARTAPRVRSRTQHSDSSRGDGVSWARAPRVCVARRWRSTRHVIRWR